MVDGVEGVVEYRGEPENRSERVSLPKGITYRVTIVVRDYRADGVDGPPEMERS